MVQTSRTFRIFVSSSFTDLKEERNALQERVFPRLQELCMQHGCRFQAIDLRWGVSEEAGLDQQTMPICLEEIQRCYRVTFRPNFLVLLGDRYGWRPLPPQIPAHEFEELCRRINADEQCRLGEWYRRDDNAVLPQYVLKPRKDAYEDNNTWTTVEHDLHAILERVIGEMGLSAENQRKYVASATEQEIAAGVLQISDAREHVFAFFRTIRDVPFDRSAKDFVDLDAGDKPDYEAYAWLKALKAKLSGQLAGALTDDDLKRQAVALLTHEHSRETLQHEFLRLFSGKVSQEIRDTAAGLFAADIPDDEVKRKLYALLFGNLYTYEAEWTGSGCTMSHLERLCDDVYHALERVILEEIGRLEQVDALEQEIMAHDTFGKDRANPKFFTGRSDILTKISNYMQSTARHPLAVFGASGSGKSALLAQAVAQFRHEEPETELVVRFVGATPESSDGRSLLASLCHQIARCYGADEASIPTDYPHLVEVFPQQLTLATAKRPLIVVLDALDQLSERDGARQLVWLPRELPKHVHLIVSTLLPDESSSPDECLVVLRHKLPMEHLVPLQPISEYEGAQLLDKWLVDAHRTLQERQRRQVLDAFERNGLPLYLKLAFEEARHWASFTPATETALKADIPGIIRNLLARLGREENHGGLLVAHSLGYLAAARHGLIEDELLDVLSADPEVRADFQQRSPRSPWVNQLPMVVWSRLYFDLEPYLSERLADGTTVLSFYHGQLSEVVREEYLAGSAQAERHVALARYFAGQSLQMTGADKQIANLRKLSEQPYQQTYGELWSELEETTLCNLHFVEAKCAAGLVYDLEGDYDRALAALPDAQPELKQARKHQQAGADYTKNLIAYARAWSEARARHAADPARYPLPAPAAIPLPTLASVLLWTNEEIQEDRERIIQTPTRLDRLRAFAAFVRSESHYLAQFTAQPGFCVQQAHNYADAGPVVEAADNLIDQGSTCQPLLLQQLFQRAAYTPHPTLLRTIEERTDEVESVFGVRAHEVESVSVTADGQTAVSGSWDKTVRVWDLVSGVCRHTLEGHTDGVTSVSVTPDGQTAVSGSWDKTVRVWDLVSGVCRHTLEGHIDKVTSVSVTPDGLTVVSGSGNGTVRVWDLTSGVCRHTLEFEDRIVGITSVSVTADGWAAVSGSSDGSVSVWDLARGELRGMLAGHAGVVTSVSVTPDGQTVVSGGYDRTVRVWDLVSGEAGHMLERHTDKVTSVSMTLDGKTAVSGSRDGFIGVWNPQTYGELRAKLGTNCPIALIPVQPERINAVSVTPDGQFAVSGEWDSSICVWDLDRGQCLYRLKGHTGWITSMSRPSDSQTIVSGSDDHTARVWDLVRGELYCTLEGYTARVTSVSVTPDGQTVVSGSEDGTVRVWNLASGVCRHTLQEQEVSSFAWEVSSVSVTPDGQTAVSGSEDGTVRMWDLISGVCRHTLEGHTAAVSSVSVTPDGQTAVSGSWDKTVRVWDLVSGVCRHTLEGHIDKVTSVSVTPDGLTAVSGSRDKTVRVWDLVSGWQRAVFPAPDAVSSLSAITAGGQLGIGTVTGEVIFVTLRNVRFAPPLITAIRLWLPGVHGVRDHWGDELTTRCIHCGRLFVPSPDVLDTIHRFAARLAPDHSPSLELPPTAWNEPSLSSQCPHCHQPLRFNPFVLDQSVEVGRVHSWLISTLVWSPFIIAVLSYCLGMLPTSLHLDRSLTWALLVGLILAWVHMGRMPTRRERTTREEVRALAGIGALVTAGALTMGLVDTPQVGLVELGLVEVAIGVVVGAAGGLASSGMKHPAEAMLYGLAICEACVVAYSVAGSLGGGLPGLVVGGVAGLVVALVMGYLLPNTQRVGNLGPVGPAGGVVIGLVAGSIIASQGYVRLGIAVALVACLAISLAVGIAGVIQKKYETDRSPRLGWGMRIAVVVSLLVLVWICFLGGWPIPVR